MKIEEPIACERWAQLRFSVVGGLLSSPPERGKLREALDELSRRRWRHPTNPGELTTFGASTIERWYYEALRASNPIPALSRKVRTDAGKARVMKPELLAELDSSLTVAAHMDREF